MYKDKGKDWSYSLKKKDISSLQLHWLSFSPLPLLDKKSKKILQKRQRYILKPWPLRGLYIRNNPDTSINMGHYDGNPGFRAAKVFYKVFFFF